MKRKAVIDCSALEAKRSVALNAPCRVPLERASVLVDHTAVPADAATKLYRDLEEGVNWSQNKVKVFNEWRQENRLSQSFSLKSNYENLHYFYGGSHHVGLSAPAVLRLCSKQYITSWLVKHWNLVAPDFPKDAEPLVRQNNWFNFVLANYYRDGKHSIGMHSDDEKELVGPIVALSLGTERHFDFQPKTTRAAVTAVSHLEKVRLSVGNGCLLFMGTGSQTYWKHGVPKQLRVAGGRISLTFRRIVERGSREVIIQDNS